MDVSPPGQEAGQWTWRDRGDPGMEVSPEHICGASGEAGDPGAVGVHVVKALLACQHPQSPFLCKVNFSPVSPFPPREEAALSQPPLQLGHSHVLVSSNHPHQREAGWRRE